MFDIQARAKENIEKADKLAKAKNELNELKITLEKENKQQYVAEKIKLINDKALNESMLRNKRQELDERQLKIEQDSKRKNELYKKWDEISNTKLEFDPDSFVCPTCKREYETEKIEEIKKQFENIKAQEVELVSEARKKENDIQVVSGATISSKSIVNAVNAAVNLFNKMEG